MRIGAGIGLVLVALAVAACGADDETSVPATTVSTASVAGVGDDVACVAEVPAWAPPELKLDDFCQIVALVDAELSARADHYSIDAADGSAEVGDLTLGLVNVVAGAAAAPPGERPAIVADHVAVVLAAPRENQPDFAATREHLRMLLYEEAYAPDGFDELVAREVTDGLFAAVVVDAPDSVGLLTAATAASWGVTEGELYELALTQTLTEPPQQAAESGLVVLFGDDDSDFYKTTWLLDLAGGLGHQLAAGALAVIPTRGEFVVHEISPGEGRAVLDALAAGAGAAFAAGPGSISDDVFWVHDGQLTAVRTEDGAVVDVPAELVDILD